MVDILSEKKRPMFSGLRAAMSYYGHTQTDLARYMGHSATYVNQRLHGKVDWSTKDINFLCDLYKKSYEDLFR